MTGGVASDDRAHSPAATASRFAGPPVAVLLLVPFLLSGSAALIAQLCWLRYLTLIVGGSAAALNIILITFMGGLAVGAALAKTVCRRTDRYLLLYAGLEAGLSLYLFVSPHVIALVGRVFVRLLPTLGHETAAEQFARLIVSGLALILPTVAMGLTTPILITASVQRFRDTASTAGLLYGINTLGAALGALVAGAYLILNFGVSRSLQLAAGLNLLAAALAILILVVSRRESGPVADSSPAPPPADGKQTTDRRRVRTLCLLAAAGGFAGMALEVIFARLLVFMIGSSYYSHTIAITGFLLGIVLGSLVIGVAARRYVPRGRHLPLLFALFGFATIISALMFERLPLTLQRYLVLQDAIDLHPLVIKLTAALALVVLPAMFSGLLLPYLIHVLTHATRNVGVAASNILTYNTVGSVLGVALTGYVLIESLGVQNALFAVTLLVFALGFYSLGLTPAAERTMRLPLVLGGVGLVLTAVLIPIKGGKRLVEHSVIYSNLDRPEILFYLEDESASVSVVEMPTRDGRRLLINGLPAAEVDPVTLSLGATTDVAMAAHLDPKTVFAAGIGSGQNAGVAGIYPGVQVDAVEISDAVIVAMPFFDRFTYDASTNPAVRVIRGDARHFLKSTDKSYDVILPDVFISALTGTAYLYNVEFFAQCARHLNPGGRVVLNVSLEAAIDRVIAASFTAAFPHVEFVTIPYKDITYLIGSNDPITFPSRPWEKWADQPEVMHRMERLGFLDSSGLDGFRTLTRDQLRAELSGTRISTDDHPIIDYLHLTGDRTQALIW